MNCIGSSFASDSDKCVQMKPSYFWINPKCHRHWAVRDEQFKNKYYQRTTWKMAALAENRYGWTANQLDRPDTRESFSPSFGQIYPCASLPAKLAATLAYRFSERTKMAGAKHAKSDSYTISLLLENTTAILQKYKILVIEMHWLVRQKLSNTVNKSQFQNTWSLSSQNA